MGFKAYRFTTRPNETWTLDQPEPLRFSGPQGLIAQWYRLNRLDVGDNPWLVPAREWLALAYGAEAAAGRWVIFEQAEGGVRKLARLDRIHGKFGSQTRIMMQFKPLQCLATAPALTVVEPECVCGWGEELSIDGGSGSSSCTWRWMAPQLGFASVVAG
ncbi:MAG TPA: hypothetical protein VK178_06145 [Opitutaceae bacterium]|nr:hypothetical protein [Opitutaceae bacterium]